MYHKKLTIDNSQGSTHLRISSVPKFDFFKYLTVVSVFQFSPKPDLNNIKIDYISSQLLNNNSPDKHFFDVPLTKGQFEIEIHITSGLDNKGVTDFTTELVDH